MNLVFFLAAFFSEVIGTMAGFGSSTIALPLALFFFDFQTALVLVAFLHIFGNLGRLGFFRHGFNRNLIINFGIPSVALALIGALLASRIEQNTLKGLLGIFLVAYASYSFWRENFFVPPTTANVIIGGSFSGFMAGLIGTGGALRGAFLTGFQPSKRKIYRDCSGDCSGCRHHQDSSLYSARIFK